MTHHSVAAHVFVAATFAQAVSVSALLAGFPPLPVLLAVTILAAAMGWLGEKSQRAWGWGTHSRLDIVITALGGPVGWGFAIGAIHV